MLIHDIVGLFSHELAVDLGASTVRVAARGTTKLVESQVRSASPEASAAVLAEAIARLHGRRWAVSPSAVASYPAGSSPSQKERLVAALRLAGVRSIFLVDNLTAAAAACGGDDGRSRIIADLGSGKINFGVVSVSGGGPTGSAGFGGHELARELAGRLSEGLGARITPAEASVLLMRVGIEGSCAQGRPVERAGSIEELGPAHVGEALSFHLKRIREGLAGVMREAARSDSLGELAPELTLVGGLARLPGLAAHLSVEMGLPVRIPPEPARAVVRGLAGLSVGEPEAAGHGARVLF